MTFSQDSLCVTVYRTMCASKHQKVKCDSLGTKTELGSALQEPRGEDRRRERAKIYAFNFRLVFVFLSCVLF